MLLLTACALTFLPLASGATAPGASVRFCPLEKSIQRADLIVSGRIASIVVPRESDGSWSSNGAYELEVDRVFSGDAREGARLVVKGCADWTCEARSVEYAVGQELFLLLDRRSSELAPVFGFPSEYLIEKDTLRQSNHPKGFVQARRFLDGMPSILAFARLPRARQPAAWVELLRHQNEEVRAFALRRFFEIHFTYDEEGDEEPYVGIEDDVLLELLAVVVASIPVDAAKRKDTLQALLNLWPEILRRPKELLARAETSRRDAIARLATPDPEVEEKHLVKSFHMRVRLGSVNDLPAVLDQLRSEQHDLHFQALSALESLVETVGLRSREVLEALAGHPEGTRCEASLGRSATSIVKVGGTDSPFGEGRPLREQAAAFRHWWAETGANIFDGR